MGKNMKNTSRFSSTQHGMALGVILVCVALIAVIGATLAIASKTGSATSETREQGLLAGTILTQANLLKTGLMLKKFSQGDAYLNSSQNYGVYYPNSGTMETQTPPIAAFADNSNMSWTYYYCCWGQGIKFMGVGLSNAYDSFMELGGLKKGVCQQINQQLLGTTNIQAPATYTWAQWQAGGLDLSNEVAVNGIKSQCIVTTDGKYVFYAVVWAY